MDVIKIIRQAIRERKPIEFEYDDGLDGKRIGNPHIIFLDTLNSGEVRMYLHLWQTEGVSKSGKFGWKKYICEQIKSVSILENLPQFTVAEGYNEESNMYNLDVEVLLLVFPLRDLQKMRQLFLEARKA